MAMQPLSNVVKRKVQSAARQLGAADPLPYVGGLIDRSFSLPLNDARYANNTLTPGAAPFEPSFSEREPNVLRFTLEPLGPGASPGSRRDEATREMRRLVGPIFGRDALKWFDGRSEEWRGMNGQGWLHYGAWFGSAWDDDGLYAAKVYYELAPNQIEAVSPSLARLVRLATGAMPSLMPIFTSIGCGRDSGSQRVTFLQRGNLALSDLGPLLNQLGLGHQLPSLMQVVGLALGGQFELPQQSVLIGLRDTEDGPEVKLEIMLGMIPDLPPNFINLLMLALAERPRQLSALQRWMVAFATDSDGSLGRFSVLSVRVTPTSSARVSLYLRPVEFEIQRQIQGSPNDVYATAGNEA